VESAGADGDRRVAARDAELREVRERFGVALSSLQSEQERLNAELTAVHRDMLGVQREAAAKHRHTFALDMAINRDCKRWAFQRWAGECVRVSVRLRLRLCLCLCVCVCASVHVCSQRGNDAGLRLFCAGVIACDRADRSSSERHSEQLRVVAEAHAQQRDAGERELRESLQSQARRELLAVHAELSQRLACVEAMAAEDRDASVHRSVSLLGADAQQRLQSQRCGVASVGRRRRSVSVHMQRPHAVWRRRELEASKETAIDALQRQLVDTQAELNEKLRAAEAYKADVVAGFLEESTLMRDVYAKEREAAVRDAGVQLLQRLCCAVLCCAVLCCAGLCWSVLFCAEL
jgi:hypothetical protein